MNNETIGQGKTGKRSFPLAYRIEFLQRWEACVERGEKVRLLRETGLARSTVARWIDARDEGHMTDSMVAAAEKSPRRLDSRNRAELARLRTENEALKSSVEKSEAAIAILGKAFELLEGIAASSKTEHTPIPPALMTADDYAAWLHQHKLS